MVGFEGHAPSPDLRRIVRDYGVGGVILFARNVEAPEQVGELVREVQSIARDAGHEWPLLVAVDQEGGRVARLKEPWTVWPPAEVLGRADDVVLARAMGAALAGELRSCGIRLDFAPVVDVLTNPRNTVIGDRALSSDPEVVSRLASSFVQGLQGGDVAACAKHFPGHGDTELDSHFALPVADHSLSRLEDLEFRPFRAAIEAGVAATMMGHVLLREVDDRLPASLSPAVTALLRDGLKYGGLVVCDDLEMKAVSAGFPPGQAAALAAKAGSDLILVCKEPDAQVEALEGIVRAAEASEISWTAMDLALERIRRLKERFVLPYQDPDPKEARRAAGTPESWALSRGIAARGGA